MNRNRLLSHRLLALVGILGIMTYAFSDHSYGGIIDLKAALLVFATPIFVAMLFQRDQIAWRKIFARLGELRRIDSGALFAELQDVTGKMSGGLSLSRIIDFSDNHGDSFVRYGGGLFSSRFATKELNDLLNQRMEIEDEMWFGAERFLGFLAKMAPYFGMLATVVGMVKLLHNMNDFSKISGAMALAMQGTLYGLISFTMVYAPLQRSINGYRTLITKRNQVVSRWFLRLTDRTDPHFVSAELECHTNKETMRAEAFVGAAEPKEAV